jgi:hypothetical protein
MFETDARSYLATKYPHAVEKLANSNEDAVSSPYIARDQDRRTIFGTTPHGGVTEKMADITEQPEALEAVVVVRDADPLGKCGPN